MKKNALGISKKLKTLRMAKSITQAELDKMAELPRSTISKIENGKREATASELIRISQSLGVNLNVFSSNDSSFVYSEEVKVIEALREIPFDDYQRLIKTLEAQVYFAAKDVGKGKKEHLQELVASLSSLSSSDQRPRSHYAEKIRIRK
jgi:transcriptional regulator with XRE-family HTH domain